MDTSRAPEEVLKYTAMPVQVYEALTGGEDEYPLRCYNGLT
jgi:hypothetical protein